MFLFERLFGVILYVFILLIISLVIMTSKKKYIGIVLFLYTILLSVMAYFYVPYSSADLYRVFQIMNGWKFIEFGQFAEYAFESSTPISELYIYLVGKIGNVNLLPAITAFIYYTNVFYILKKSNQKYNMSGLSVSIILFFVMATGDFVGVISGIRNHLAFSIIAVCIFRELVEEKAIIFHIPLYLIAALMHNAAFALVIIRFIFLAFQFSKKKSKKIFYFSFAIILITLISVYGETYITALTEKALNYFTGDPYKDIWGYLISISTNLTIFMLMKSRNKLKKHGIILSETQNIYRFSKLVLLLSVVSIFEFSTFARFTSLNVIICIPWILQLMNKNLVESISFRNTKTIPNRTKIIAASCFILLIAGSRYNLSALKFFAF